MKIPNLTPLDLARMSLTLERLGLRATIIVLIASLTLGLPLMPTTGWWLIPWALVAAAHSYGVWKDGRDTVHVVRQASARGQQ